jgi:hypothetical protein
VLKKERDQQMSKIKIPFIGSLIESLSAEFKDKIKPIPGSVLRCDLAGGANFLGGTLCHTGIYLGDDRIVEITKVGRKGVAKVHIVDPSDFLNGKGTNFVRTGINIYVATDGEGHALGCEDIAKRALDYRIAHRSRGTYDLIDNNCHTFSVRCVSGVEPGEAQLTEHDIESALKEKFGCSRVTWEPTGFSTVSLSFDDDND